MRRRDFIKLIGGGAVAWPLAARAQQPEYMGRVGVLMGYPEGDKQAQAGVSALRKGLQNLGWIEGQNIHSDYRWAGPDPENARTYAKELSGMSPDVIVSSTNQVTAIVQHETRTIPIVFAFGVSVASRLDAVGASHQTSGVIESNHEDNYWSRGHFDRPFARVRANISYV